METLGFLVLTVLDLLGAFIISLSIFNKNLEHYSTGLKAGLVLAMLGLLGQAFRNYIFLTTGHSSTDSELPLWAFKDIGIFLVAFFWLRFKLVGDK